MKKIFFLIICTFTYFSTSMSAFTKNEPIIILITATAIYVALSFIYKVSKFIIVILFVANLAFLYLFYEYNDKILDVISQTIGK